MENRIKDIRFFVLNILKDGKITVEEADKIISFINATEELLKSKKIDFPNTESLGNFAKEGVSRFEKLVNDIGENLEKVAQNIGTRLNIPTDGQQQTQKVTEKYSYTETQHINIEENLKKLVLENHWGGVKIIGEERSDILLNINKIIWTKNEELANDRSEAFKIKTSQIEDTLKILLPQANANLRDTVNMEILIPKHLELDIATSNGEILLYDVENPEKDLKLKSTGGNIEVKPVRFKKTFVDTKDGDVSLKHIDSSINIETTSGHVEFSGIVNSESKIISNTGNIRGKAGVNQNLELITNKGSIDFKQNRTKECDSIQLITDTGNISYRGVILSKFKVQTNSGEITGISHVTGKGEVEINSESSDITWKAEDYNNFKFNCISNKGNVFTNIENDSLEKTPKSLSGKVNTGDANININTVSGDIRLNIANIGI